MLNLVCECEMWHDPCVCMWLVYRICTVYCNCWCFDLLRPILFWTCGTITSLIDDFGNYDLLSSIPRQKMNKNSRKNYVFIVFSFWDISRFVRERTKFRQRSAIATWSYVTEGHVIGDIANGQLSENVGIRWQLRMISHVIWWFID